MNNYFQINRQIWEKYYQHTVDTQLSYTPKISVHTLNHQSKPQNIVILQYQDIPSTMILSDNWPRQLLNDTTVFCFIAKQQSKGVGQKDNKWMSPLGNLYMTLLITQKIAKLQQIPIRVVNSIVDTLTTYIDKKYVKCKWVNDIFLEDKKVSGILIKHQVMSGNSQIGISQIGIGINIKKSPSVDFTRIQQFSVKSVDINDFRSILLENIMSNLNKASFKQHLTLYSSYLMYLNENVCIFDSNFKTVLQEGYFKGVNELGHCLIETQQKTITVFDGRMRKKYEQQSSSFKPVNIKQIMAEL